MMPGPVVRTDVVDVYVFRIQRGTDPAVSSGSSGHAGYVEFLQMHRVGGAMAATWQPVMGHVESGPVGTGDEPAAGAALRELAEETGYAPDHGLVAFWQLESVNTYFLASQNCVMMSPCFAAQVVSDTDPVPDRMHDGFRWVRRDHADRDFIWPGQRIAIEQIVRDILPAVLAADDRTDPDRYSVAQLLRIDVESPTE